MRKNAYAPEGGFKFDGERGHVSLDGKGRPIFNYKKNGNKITVTHNKTRKSKTFTMGKDI